MLPYRFAISLNYCKSLCSAEFISTSGLMYFIPHYAFGKYAVVKTSGKVLKRHAAQRMKYDFLSCLFVQEPRINNGDLFI